MHTYHGTTTLLRQLHYVATAERCSYCNCKYNVINATTNAEALHSQLKARLCILYIAHTRQIIHTRRQFAAIRMQSDAAA